MVSQTNWVVEVLLSEIHIENLGVIDDANIVLGSGLVALTGETGAGKTMIVEAISLLLGGRADSSVIRSGADEARVDGRFVSGETEQVLARVISREGKSRAYLNGRLATVAQLAEIGTQMVDLHGQNAHQSLLKVGAQRAALDLFGKIDLQPLRAARARLTEIDAGLALLGGDSRTRARDIDLLRFQVTEINSARIISDIEDSQLESEEDLLSQAANYRETFESCYTSINEDNGALDVLRTALTQLSGGAGASDLALRLRGVVSELEEIATELRSAGESIEENPQRLEEIRERRHLLRELRRKYGDGLDEVLQYANEARVRLEEMLQHDARVAELEQSRVAALAELDLCEQAVLKARRHVAPKLAKAITLHLPGLAMANARLEITVEGTAGQDVEFRFSANPGMPLQQIAKVASGGETARLMLAVNLVLSAEPQTLIFDEVDAGIGGETANTVAEALAKLGDSHQVVVVTHLPQVAAVARQHISVTKEVRGTMTFASPTVLNEAERVSEIARMLSGNADSKAAVQHAKEMLQRGQSRPGVR